MNIGQLLVWSNTIPALISAGIMVEGQVASLIKSFHPGMTDSDINAVAALLVAGAQAHRATAAKDAGLA